MSATLIPDWEATSTVQHVSRLRRSAAFPTLRQFRRRLNDRHDLFLKSERDLARAWNPSKTPRPGSDPSWVLELLYLELSRRCFVSLLRQAQAAWPGHHFGYPEG